jgi:hypothetical protein
VKKILFPMMAAALVNGLSGVALAEEAKKEKDTAASAPAKQAKKGQKKGQKKAHTHGNMACGAGKCGGPGGCGGHGEDATKTAPAAEEKKN